MLPCKKIYIDTKHGTIDSISNSNFRWELPETLTLPHNTIFYVDDICIPHSWYTIETNVNGRLYMQLTNNHTTVGTKTNNCDIIVLSPGNYTLETLAVEMKAKINDSFASTVVNVTFDALGTNTITVTPTNASDLMKIQTSVRRIPSRDFGCPKKRFFDTIFVVCFFMCNGIRGANWRARVEIISSVSTSKDSHRE